QAHDRAGVDGLAVLGDTDLGVEGAGQLDELGGGAGVQAALVDDLDGANGARRHFSPASTYEATEMYLRPASWAQRTASSSGRRERIEASLISIGRLRPAITSALVCSMTEIARLDGVPPNMSVSRMTPEPSFTRPQAARMSLR